MGRMKWWGWGDEGVSFKHQDKPALGPFLQRGAFGDLGVNGYIMCHLSHSYHSGACLYFTFAFKPSERRDPLEEHDVVKSAIQQTFMDSGATLSHHHAVGTEHSRWLEQDISAPGIEMLRALFDGMDPGANLNPGKIV
jgi:alkyldihydroxyacetonephosphate synthase